MYEALDLPVLRKHQIAQNLIGSQLQERGQRVFRVQLAGGMSKYDCNLVIL
jgi:hypothetical protein